MIDVFQQHESEVRSYCRSFPVVFDRACGALIYDTSGVGYIDFLSGAGALNYGHNHPYIKQRLISYLESDRIVHALDLHTAAKADFLRTFHEYVLAPQGYDYKIQFCGPTGTNAVEAALKLARKVAGRSAIVAFMGSFHGVSQGSLSVTSHDFYRQSMSGGSPVTFVPYEFGTIKDFESLAYLRGILEDTHSGMEKPAAIILETVQCEGGIHVASGEWLRGLAALCHDHKIILICDDIQAGCYRTGSFFSFQRAGITPDIVTLSKSISGYGLPMALVLIRPDLDQWSPGEHNGTFRGNQAAFVGGTAALELAREINLERHVHTTSIHVREFLTGIAEAYPGLEIRGLGMVWGIDFSGLGGGGVAQRVMRRCFQSGLIIERAGRDQSVLKLLPPLIIDLPTLYRGLETIRASIDLVIRGE